LIIAINVNEAVRVTLLKLADNRMSHEDRSKIEGGPQLKVLIRRYHGVCRWTWNVNGGEEDEVCGICQSAFEGTAPGVPFPGDECPVVFGKCSHAFHLICLQKWISGSRNNCPICRREWEFGENKASSTGGEDPADGAQINP
jgi:anaphase-promoting complex subunit 11